MEDRISLIIASLSGGSVDFYQDIFTSRNVGSGGELEIDGWFTADFFQERCSSPKIENFPMMWSLVPFTNIESGRKFTDVYGCFYNTLSEDGFHVPEYGHFTLEH